MHVLVCVCVWRVYMLVHVAGGGVGVQVGSYVLTENVT